MNSKREKEQKPGLPLAYRSLPPPQPGALGIHSTVVVCVIYGLLSLPLLGIGGLLVVDGTRRGGSQAIICYCSSLILFGLAGILIYWCIWYFRFIHRRR